MNDKQLIFELEQLIEYIREVGRMEKRKEVSGFFLSIMEKVLTPEEYMKWRGECK
jgi:hypothetical protein|tara:strand:+ start:100 stop:264 length:165 start_codon:yes stop_codon:yes gene_type:complete